MLLKKVKHEDKKKTRKRKKIKKGSKWYKKRSRAGEALRVRLDILHLKVGGKGLTELVGLLVVLEDQGVKVARAANLELGGLLLGVLLDADLLGVLPASNNEELLDVSDLLRHCVLSQE